MVRRRASISIPPTIKIVTKATKQTKVASLQQYKKEVASRQLNQQPARPTPTPPIAHSAVSHRQRRSTRRNVKTKVQYKFRETTPESTVKIKGVRGKGRDRILIIIGNGPSITEAPLEKLKTLNKVDILSINKPDPRVWPTTHWAFFDVSQMRRHEGIWNSYNGIIFNSTAIKKQKAKSMMFKNVGGQGWSRDLSKGIHIGRSSVYASMQIALWMDYEHIYIFGCDMNSDGINGKLHFYGDNPDVKPETRANRFEKEAAYYSRAVKVLTAEEREKFTFCTEYNPWGFIKDFGSMSHKTAPDSIIEHARSI